MAKSKIKLWVDNPHTDRRGRTRDYPYVLIEGPDGVTTRLSCAHPALAAVRRKDCLIGVPASFRGHWGKCERPAMPTIVADPKT